MKLKIGYFNDILNKSPFVLTYKTIWHNQNNMTLKRRMAYKLQVQSFPVMRDYNRGGTNCPKISAEPPIKDLSIETVKRCNSEHNNK